MSSVLSSEADARGVDEAGLKAARAIGEEIRLGKPVSDVLFDRVYPHWARRLSSRFWTPVNAALRAASLLAPDAQARVLDVGAGLGKLCAIGALATGASFTGIEQRPRLVEAGRQAMSDLGVTSATLELGALADVDLSAFDALYFFNPFEENLFSRLEQIDQSIALSEDRFREDVALSERALAQAKVGTRVVTYHGFGGRIPASYQLMTAEIFGSGYLRLWVKVG